MRILKLVSVQMSYAFLSQWEVPNVYGNVILGIKDSLTRDLVYILMAKGLHCCAIKVSKPSELTGWFGQLNLKKMENLKGPDLEKESKIGR